MIRLCIALIAFLFSPTGLTSTVDELIKNAEDVQYSDPHTVIALLETVHTDHVLSAEQLFDSEFLRFRALIKLGYYEKADSVLQTLKKSLNDKPKAAPWLAIMTANMQLIRFQKDDAKNSLAPFIDQYTASKPSPMKAWYNVISGAISVRENNFDRALPLLNTAYNYAKARNDPTVEMAVLDQLMNVFYYMKNYDKSIEQNTLLKSRASELGDQFTIAKTLSNEMNIYYMRSLAEQETISELKTEENIDSTLIEEAETRRVQFLKAASDLETELMAYSREIGAFQLEIRALINKQNRLLKEKQYWEVVGVSKTATTLARENQLLFEEAVSQNNMAIAYRALKQHDKGISALKRAEMLYAQIENDQFNLWILEDYSLAYEADEQYEQALTYYKKFHSADVTLRNKTNNKVVLALKEQFEADQKEQEIRRLEQQNELKKIKISNQRMQIGLFIGLGAAIFLMMLLQYNRNITISRKNKKLDVLNQRLKDQSLRDPLTGLYNRRMLEELEDQLAGNSLLEIKGDSDRLNVGMVMLDIDNFKEVNDTYGHDVGDNVIKHLSNEISQELRRGDIAIRLGGEEFLVVLFNVDEEGASAFCKRLLKTRNENTIIAGDHDLTVTASLGYVVFPFSLDDTDWLDWDEAIKIADNLLYRAKRNGRNRAETLLFSDNELGSLHKKTILKNLMDDTDSLPKSVKPMTLTYALAS